MGVERGWEIKGKENPEECRNSRYKGRAITFRADIEDSRKSLPKTPPAQHTHTHPMAEIRPCSRGHSWSKKTLMDISVLKLAGNPHSRTYWKLILGWGGKKAVQGMSQQRQFALKLHKVGVEGIVRGGGVGGSWRKLLTAGCN